MLLRFGISNFGSFNANSEFSLYPGKISAQHKEHVIGLKDFEVLKGAGIFGPNGSGKSWTIAVLPMLRDMVLAYNHPSLVLSRKFLLDKQDDTCFEVDFSNAKTAYRYTIHTNGIDVTSESLSILGTRGRTKFVYQREGLQVKLGTCLRQSMKWYQQRTFKSSAFFLKQLENDGIFEHRDSISGSEHILATLNFFNSIFALTPHLSERFILLDSRFDLNRYQKFLKEFLCEADLGINDVIYTPVSEDKVQDLLARIPAQLLSGIQYVLTRDDAGGFFILNIAQPSTGAYRIRTVHQRVPFDSNFESMGTIRMIELSSYFYRLTDPNYEIVLFVDELDCRLHPALARYLLQKHLENKNAKSQLIASLHESSLMSNEIWRSDEIWYTEKRIDGSTDLYSLYQFKPRLDKSLEKGYREGRYGAIPLLGEQQ